jgi:hypothetical protein
MTPDQIFAMLQLADLAVKTGTDIYQQLQTQTGKSLEEIRAERDALSVETHSIIDEELASLKK